MKKLHLFLLTVALGAIVSSRQIFANGFTEEAIHGWVLDTLFVAALVGFVAVKYLKSKNKLY